MIRAVIRRDQAHAVIDGMAAANDLDPAVAVPARFKAPVDAPLEPIKLGGQESHFKFAAPSRLYWAPPGKAASARHEQAISIGDLFPVTIMAQPPRQDGKPDAQTPASSRRLRPPANARRAAPRRNSGVGLLPRDMERRSDGTMRRIVFETRVTKQRKWL